MGDEKKSIFQRFNDLSGIKKVSICAVALIVLLLLASVLSMSLLQIKEYNPQIHIWNNVAFLTSWFFSSSVLE